MQGDHRLAGSGPTLHHEHALVWRADDDVLLGLDGGDNVAELSAATLAQRGEQRAVATQLRLVEAFVFANAEVVLAEEFVFDRLQLPTVNEKVAPTHELHRVTSGGAIKGLSNLRAPVDHDLVVVFVGHGEAPDVKRLGLAPAVGGAVDTTENEGRVANVEIVQHLHQFLVKVVALVALLEGAARLTCGQFANPEGLLPDEFEALVGAIDVRLFSGKIGMFGHFGG